MGEYCNNYPGSISEEPNGEFTHLDTDLSLCSSVHGHKTKNLRLRTSTHQGNLTTVSWLGGSLLKVLYYPNVDC